MVMHECGVKGIVWRFSLSRKNERRFYIAEWNITTALRRRQGCWQARQAAL
jgi:hypothetical protein